MKTINAGLITLLRMKISRLAESGRPFDRQDDLLRRAELSLYAPPGESSSGVIQLLEAELRVELGIRA